jgi:hypothetical protein
MAFMLVIMLPPMIHGYIYPSSGDDSGLHLSIIKNGDLFNQLYYGHLIIGYPIKWFASLTGFSINSIFLWFNYLALVGAGYTLFFVMSKLVNFKSGLLSLIIPFFVSLGFWWQFDDGMVFNIISIGIILPLFAYFLIRWITQKKTHQFVLVFVLGILYSAFHSTGIYLAPTLGILLLAYVIRNKRKSDISIVSVLVGLVVIGSIVSYGLYTHTQVILPKAISYSFQGRLFPFIYYIEGISFVGLIILITSFYLGWRMVNLESKLLIYGFGVLSVLLLLASLGISPSPDRQIFDLSSILAFIVCVIAGVALKYNKSFNMVVIALIVIGVSLNTSAYIGYRNAVKPLDIKAIDYVNTLDIKSFTTSSTIAPLIYKQYIKDEYVNGQADILITRNKAMTPVSDEKSIAYMPHGTSTNGYTLDRAFIDSDLMIEIYRRETIVP